LYYKTYGCRITGISGTPKKYKGILSTASPCNDKLIQPVVDAKKEATTVGHGV
jgi:hypothetical protein